MNRERILQKILHSGELEQIVKLPEEDILEHFGEDSFEHLAYEQREADKIWKKKNKPKREYIIPTRTESPARTKVMLYDWIKDFHVLNGMKLPSGISKRNKLQLLGMYYGMRRSYNIKEEEVIVRNQFY